MKSNATLVEYALCCAVGAATTFVLVDPAAVRGMSAEAWAAWVQAIGVLAGLAGAINISRAEQEKALGRELARQREALRTRAVTTLDAMFAVNSILVEIRNSVIGEPDLGRRVMFVEGFKVEQSLAEAREDLRLIPRSEILDLDLHVKTRAYLTTLDIVIGEFTACMSAWRGGQVVPVNWISDHIFGCDSLVAMVKQVVDRIYMDDGLPAPYG